MNKKLQELQNIQESSDKLMRIMNKHLKDGCIVVSAQRGQDVTPAEKNARLGILKKYLKDAGYSYIVVDGRYVYQENEYDEHDNLIHKKGDASDEYSCIVPFYNRKKNISEKEFEEFAKQICKDMEQECVLLCYDGMFWWEDAKGKTRAEFDDIKIANVMSVFYTKLRKGEKDHEGFELTGMKEYVYPGDKGYTGDGKHAQVVENAVLSALIIDKRPNPPSTYLFIEHATGEKKYGIYGDYDLLSETYIFTGRITLY